MPLFLQSHQSVTLTVAIYVAFKVYSHFLFTLHSKCTHIISFFLYIEIKQIDQGAIVRFLDNLTQDSWDKHSVANGMSFPLKFDSLEQEVNILSLIDILNTGHGYRKELHEDSDRGAFETIVFGIMSFH